MLEGDFFEQAGINNNVAKEAIDNSRFLEAMFI
jgi:hypothetical protein